MLCTRRDLIRISAAAICGAALGRRSVSAQERANLGHNRLVLLGTRGGPFVSGYSPGPSANLLVYNGIPYVIDTGFGVTFKLIEAGVPLAMLRYIFITHHHSDHNLELGPLLYNSWIAGLRTPIDVYAPIGLKTLLTKYWESNAYDLGIRIADEGRQDPRRLVIAHEYSEGSILTNPDVKVSALRNIHPPVKESYALKFDFGTKTVVFSGDTTYFPPLAEFAKGADYLVHEVLYGPALDAMVGRRPNAGRLKGSIMSHHTLAEDVGRIAARAHVKALVLNHFVPGDDPSLTPNKWSDAVRRTFSGEIVVGRDLLQLPL